MNRSTLPELISPYFFLNEKFYDEVKPANFPNTIIRYRNNNFKEFSNIDDQEWINFINHWIDDQKNKGFFNQTASKFGL